MAYFGEINEPSTRTAWEDWDDDQAIESFPKLHLQSKIDHPAEIDNFIILEGRYFYNSVRAHAESLVHINSIPEVNLHLYKTKEHNNYLCIIKDYNLVQSSDIIETLKNYVVDSIDVIAVTMKPLVEYQVAQSAIKDYVIRSLSTSKQSPMCVISNISSLEQPNMIAGVAAGALYLREVIDKPALGLVLYIDHPEQQEISELHNLFLTLHITPLIVKNVKMYNMLDSNLYI